jgi:GT2 family glycosyltransferase
MRRPPVSLILPNRNNGPVLDLALHRLWRNTTYPDFELVVVDDGSTDASRQVLRRWRDARRFPSFTLLEREPRGAAVALNDALAHARGELVVQLDGDATVETPRWLERMVDFLTGDERIGVVGAGVVADNGRVHAYGVNVVTPDGMHDRGTHILEPVGRRTEHSRVRRPRAGEAPEGRALAEVDTTLGCCMLYRRALAEELGGYDTNFSPVWFDDLDLCLSARRLGRKVFVMPEVEILHRLSMRNSRAAGGPVQFAGAAARRAIGRFVPQDAKDVLLHALRMDRPTEEHLERLRHHYDYWRRKWGFDPLNPDLDAVRRRYGATEVCWAYDPERVAAGRAIIAGAELPSAGALRVA